MPQTKSAVVISIKPQFAERIFDGNKTVELRRKCPKIVPGDYLFVYVSSPTKAFKGLLRVRRIVCRPPKSLWREVGKFAGISKTEFDTYYHGASTGFGIFISVVEELDLPIGLSKIRRSWKSFRPPQSYMYVARESMLRRLCM
jgi:predicted transcriptional regulator